MAAQRQANHMIRIDVAKSDCLSGDMAPTSRGELFAVRAECELLDLRVVVLQTGGEVQRGIVHVDWAVPFTKRESLPVWTTRNTRDSGLSEAKI